VIRSILIAGAAYLYFTRWGSTPACRDEAGRPIPGSVAEMQRVGLGGVKQSITIRGEDAQAPILIWLHGGPGMDATGMWRRSAFGRSWNLTELSLAKLDADPGGANRLAESVRALQLWK